MSTIICIGGSYHPDILEYIGVSPKNSSTRIIAADSGYAAAAALGLQPQVIIGDFDSIQTDSVDPQCEIIKHAEDKDFSDTELAVELAIDRYGMLDQDIIIIGGGEGRLDHTYALIQSIHDAAARIKSGGTAGADVFWYTAYECIIFLKNNRCIIHAEVGTLLSVFPLFISHTETRVCSVSSSGLQWPLDAVDFSQGMYSLSNRVTKSPCSVTTEEMDLMITISLEGYKKAAVH
jgi:thiamine pyrophosphokinase